MRHPPSRGSAALWSTCADAKTGVRMPACLKADVHPHGNKLTNSPVKGGGRPPLLGATVFILAGYLVIAANLCSHLV